MASHRVCRKLRVDSFYSIFSKCGVLIEAEGAPEREDEGHVENWSWRLKVILILNFFDLPVDEDADEVDDENWNSG